VTISSAASVNILVKVSQILLRSAKKRKNISLAETKGVLSIAKQRIAARRNCQLVTRMQPPIAQRRILPRRRRIMANRNARARVPNRNAVSKPWSAQRRITKNATMVGRVVSNLILGSSRAISVLRGRASNAGA